MSFPPSNYIQQIGNIFPQIGWFKACVLINLKYCVNRHFEATEARFLRASYSAFVDVLTLATKTIEQFGANMAL